MGQSIKRFLFCINLAKWRDVGRQIGKVINGNIVYQKPYRDLTQESGRKTREITAKGKAKDEIGVSILINDKPRSFKSGLSGGMQTAVSLVVDTALRNVLGYRTGRTWPIYMLDEPFYGLDLVSKAACIQALQKLGEDTLVLLVDHHTEILESLQQIQITYENGVSRVE